MSCDLRITVAEISKFRVARILSIYGLRERAKENFRNSVLIF